MRVLGVDGCRAGWLGIVLNDGHCEALCAPRIADLVTDAGPVEGIAIDIPIGLLDRGRRTADAAARACIGKLGRSVFATPVRSALSARPFAVAVAESVRLSGTGLSQQAYALRAKIFDVEGVAASEHTAGVGGTSGGVVRYRVRRPAEPLQAHLGGNREAPGHSR